MAGVGSRPAAGRPLAQRPQEGGQQTFACAAPIGRCRPEAGTRRSPAASPMNAPRGKCATVHSAPLHRVFMFCVRIDPCRNFAVRPQADFDHSLLERHQL